MFPCIWESLVEPDLCLSRTTMVEVAVEGAVCPLLGLEKFSNFSLAWRIPLVPWDGETFRLSAVKSRSIGCGNRPLLGKLCWCCIINCYPLSVLFFVSMAASSGKGPSRCPDTCTPLWGQCHNLFWATLCCCFLMLPCQLWAVQPISVLSSQGRTFLGSFNGAEFSFEKAKQVHLKRRLSMKRHLTVLQIVCALYWLGVWWGLFSACPDTLS